MRCLLAVILLGSGLNAQERLLVDLNPGPGHTLWGHRHSMESFTNVYGRTIFATTFPNGVWTTDGTTGNATLLAAVGGPFGNAVANFVPALGEGFFAAADSRGLELWQTDGTRIGTRVVRDLPGHGYGVTRVDAAAVEGKLLFHGHSGNLQTHLWATDGTRAGTQRLGNVEQPFGFIHSGRFVYFLAGPPGRADLWRSDGTLAGTAKVATVFATRLQSYPMALPDGRTVWLILGLGYELWISDGTTAGTKRLARLSGNPALLPEATSKGFFYYDNRQGRTDLWFSDGTDAGLRIASSPTNRDWVPRVEGAVFGDRLLFPFASAAAGRELWISDGTPAGTGMLRDLLPGSRSSDPYSMVVTSKRAAYFLAGNSLRHYRLWRTDGTRTGTVQVGSVQVEGRLTHIGKGLYFPGNTPATGREPFVYDLPHASAHRIGEGCTASGSPIEVDMTDPVLGQMQTTTIRRAAPRRAGMVTLGVPRSPLRVSAACSVYVDLSLPWLPLPFGTDASGRATTVLVIPAQSQLLDVRLGLQAVVGPTARSPMGLDLSSGWHWTLGR